jgi:beta-1,4-mannosyl-glycoprotein beta-1,4-N-acetylglucosaminyltransferase
MTYEFFYLHDEVDWLDVKLHEAGDMVDKFVVIECPYDLLHRKKPLYFGDNKSRFSEFRDKIIHVVADDKIVIGVNMVRTRLAECYQGFTRCKPYDILILTDPDVVLKRKTYEALRYSRLENNEVSLECDWYMYYMDALFVKEKFTCCSAFLYKNTIDHKWGTVNRFKPIRSIIRNAGWHFSKMGGAEVLADHIDGYPAGHCDYPNLIGREATVKLMQERIDHGLCWEEGYPGEHVVKQLRYKSSDYPEYVVNHPEIYAKYFLGGMNETDGI